VLPTVTEPREAAATGDVHPVDLADDAGVDGGERILERQRCLTRRDEVDDLVGPYTDAVDSDDRPANSDSVGRDRLNPLQRDRRQRVLLDRRDDATHDLGELHARKDTPVAIWL